MLKLHVILGGGGTMASYDVTESAYMHCTVRYVLYPKNPSIRYNCVFAVLCQIFLSILAVCKHAIPHVLTLQQVLTFLIKLRSCMLS